MTSARSTAPATEKKQSHVVVMAPMGMQLDPLVVDDLLQAAYRRRVVTKFDSGHGIMCWFEGPSSDALAELRTEILQRAQPVAPR